MCLPRCKVDERIIVLPNIADWCGRVSGLMMGICNPDEVPENIDHK